MSFEKLTKKEIVRTAEDDFGVEVNKDHTKKQLIEQLDAEGVSFDMYLDENPDQREKFQPPAAAGVITAPVPSVDEVYDVPVVTRDVVQPALQQDKILVKMTRTNPLYEIKGYRFTQDHPYQFVTVEDSDYILLEEDGFRQATPREVQEYYS